jgi:hypothetical protein
MDKQIAALEASLGLKPSPDTPDCVPLDAEEFENKTAES